MYCTCTLYNCTCCPFATRFEVSRSTESIESSAWKKTPMSRPEFTAPPQIFYNDVEARKYTHSSRVVEIQERLTERAVELLNIPDDGVPRLLLDVGCGSGLSGERLTSLGHEWIGTDISMNMLEVAQEREVLGGVVQYDMGHGCPFRPGVFDGCISISAIQWLCNADNSLHRPRRRLASFFNHLYRCLKRGSKAVLQFYPDNAEQVEMITTSALRVGFSGGLVVDYPNSTRAKKYFLVLAAGSESSATEFSASTHICGLVGDELLNKPGINIVGRKKARKNLSPSRKISSVSHSRSKRHPDNKGRAWIEKKKSQAQLKGKETARNSKYTGRKRKDRI